MGRTNQLNIQINIQIFNSNPSAIHAASPDHSTRHLQEVVQAVQLAEIWWKEISNPKSYVFMKTRCEPLTQVKIYEENGYHFNLAELVKRCTFPLYWTKFLRHVNDGTLNSGPHLLLAEKRIWRLENTSLYILCSPENCMIISILIFSPMQFSKDEAIDNLITEIKTIQTSSYWQKYVI